jgi:hypothetical protein
MLSNNRNDNGNGNNKNLVPARTLALGLPDDMSDAFDAFVNFGATERGEYVGDLLRFNGKRGIWSYGAQNAEMT